MTDHRRRQKQKRKPKPGQKVILKALPPRFIDDLSEEDQRAISAMVGKPIMLNRYERDGSTELEFTDNEDAIHVIYVDPRFIKLW